MRSPARSVEHTRAFELDAPASRLFPLFSPAGEKLWVPGWDYENVTGSSPLSEDQVFLTGAHDQAGVEAIWLVKRYRPERHLIELYRVEPGVKVGVVRVQCTELDSPSAASGAAAPVPARTEVRVTYRYIALSEEGERFIEEFTPEAYEAFMGEWQMLLRDYLRAAG